MTQRVVLHVGAMKSGTSHVQSLLFANQALLAERGILVPGAVWRDQVDAVVEALGWGENRPQMRTGLWSAFVDQIRAHDGPSLISMEYLARAPVDRIRGVVGHFPGLRVEAVVSARDLGRNIPAMWQERVKNGSTTSFADYVEAIRERADGEGKAFWREQNSLAIVRRWSEVLGPDAVTVVTVPPRGAPRELLWSRFAEAFQIDGAGLVEPAASNESLGAPSAEFLRRLNTRMAEREPRNFSAVLKHRLAKQTLAPHRPQESPIGFEVPDWLTSIASRTVRRLPRLGARIVGDPADLRALSTHGVDPAEVSAEEQLAAAVVGAEGLVLAVAAMRDAARKTSDTSLGT